MDYQLGPGPLQVDQNIIDEKIKGDIGIVENGDVATHAIPSGYYVIWKGDLYVAKTDISSGTTLSSASNGNLTAKTQGIGADVAALNSNFSWKTVPSTTGTEIMTLPDANTAKEFIFVAQYGTSSGMQAMTFTFHIPNVTAINGLTPTQGYYRANSNAICQISVDCLNHRAYLVLLEISGGTYTSTSRLMCFYR